MLEYQAPLRDYQFVLHELLKVSDTYAEIERYAEVNEELIDAVAAEAGKVCEKSLLPLNQIGDQQGCHLENGNVTTPQGFKEAYDIFSQSGWIGLSANPEYGGQGLPELLNILVHEMIMSTNMSFGDYIGLPQGVITVLDNFADDVIKDTYLPKLISGEWCATMCMTEPHCGTDVGLLRTKAEENADGSYTISGTKIFISGGDHDLTDNIIHLVLARTTNSPPGVRGISLFVVPKFIPDDQGSNGERNPVHATSLEHKMGYAASATCQMSFEGAKGWLVGEVDKGLRLMFTMVNATRILTGLQGLGTSETAYQAASHYAKDRLQGRSLTGPAYPEKSADPLIVHPDVRRMLLSSRAFNEGGRALALWLALQLDISGHHPDEDKREKANDIVGLLTPVVKACFSDMGFESCNNCMQIFGGHGYIEDYGVEQLVRDCRIAQIQEGANGIQALDLIGRKLTMNNGRAYQLFISKINDFILKHENDADLQPFVAPLKESLGKLQDLTDLVLSSIQDDINEMGAAGVDYQRIFGLVSLGWMWAEITAISIDKTDDAFYDAKVRIARYFFDRMLPQIDGLASVVRAGGSSMMEIPEAYF